MNTEIMVTFDKETKKNGGCPVYHFFPAEFIYNKPAEETALFKSIRIKTGYENLAKRIVDWAKSAKPNERRSELGVNVSVERW